MIRTNLHKNLPLLFIKKKKKKKILMHDVLCDELSLSRYTIIKYLKIYYYLRVCNINTILRIRYQCSLLYTRNTVRHLSVFDIATYNKPVLQYYPLYTTKVVLLQRYFTRATDEGNIPHFWSRGICLLLCSLDTDSRNNPVKFLTGKSTVFVTCRGM